MSAPPTMPDAGHDRLIAGFDAGQTHTTCRLARLGDDACWQPLADGRGGGVSHLAAAAAERRFDDALRGSLRAALLAAGLPADTALTAAVVGASGIEAGTVVQQRGEELAAQSLALPRQRLQVWGDEQTALNGALGQEPGVLVISGTGCITLGRDGAGRHHRCGGWGWLLDGAGSAMDIGRDGLALSVQMADGRLEETPLRQQLWQALAATTPQQVKAAVVAEGFGAAGFARLAPLVDALAGTGDAQAQAVMQRNAQALAAMVATVVHQLDLKQPTVCGVGGALQHLRTLHEAFMRELQRACPQATLRAPRGDACDGALHLAAQAALRC